MGKENQLKKMTAHWIVLPHEACCSQYVVAHWGP